MENSMICPVCCAEMQECIYASYIECPACGFLVTQLEALRLGARTPQEAADLKYGFLIAQGWSPYPILGDYNAD